ncbi:MAG TPA: hypothetical protein DDZ51_26090 [Planctomycetaceae bacterium]|nr:hypothetical protein [Planctomycetaceae bacterium]
MWADFAQTLNLLCNLFAYNYRSSQKHKWHRSELLLKSDLSITQSLSSRGPLVHLSKNARQSHPKPPEQATQLAGLLRWLNIAVKNRPREALLSEHPMQTLEPVLHRIDTSSGTPPVSTKLICSRCAGFHATFHCFALV